MGKFIIILLISFLPVSIYGSGLINQEQDNDSLIFKGQLSGWMNVNPTNDFPVGIGGRYLPQVNYSIELPKTRTIDFEASANLFGNAQFQLFDSAISSGSINPYRVWARYSGKQFEIRAGLQKINFGSASIIRPLMWFEQIDPRDPLQITNGVWGVLGRYYFLNNANIWIWGLYGNKNLKGWEVTKTNRNYPEFGGRIQYPIPHGEGAISYHHRIADTRGLSADIPAYAEIQENRIGFDARFDLVLGFWVEGSWINKNADLNEFTNQEFLNAGFDYTFGIGNGLYLIFEQLVASYDERAFSFSNTSTSSALSLSYPLGLFNNISAIVYYDWINKGIYNFVNYQLQLQKITLYIMGYWNPEEYRIPNQGGSENQYSGRGVQLMFVFNH